MPVTLKHPLTRDLLWGSPLIKKGAEMPTITLPDNSQREFEQALTVMQVSESIGPGLAKATLGGMSMINSLMRPILLRKIVI